MIAALAVSTVLVTSTAVVVGTNYVTTQASAQVALVDSIATGKEKVDAVTERIADLELAIKNSQAILNDSNGKVLDEASRQKLEKSIATAQSTLKAQKASLVKLKASVSSLKTATPLDVLWPYGQEQRAQAIQDTDSTSVESLVKTVMALGRASKMSRRHRLRGRQSRNELLRSKRLQLRRRLLLPVLLLEMLLLKAL